MYKIFNFFNFDNWLLFFFDIWIHMFFLFNDELDIFFFSEWFHTLFLLRDQLDFIIFFFKISCWAKKSYKVSSSDSDICMCLMMTKMLYFCFSSVVQNQIFKKSSVTCQILIFYERKTNLFFKIIIANLSQLIICSMKSCISERKLQMIKFWKFLIIWEKIWITIHSVLISILDNVFKIWSYIFNNLLSMIWIRFCTSSYVDR